MYTVFAKYLKRIGLRWKLETRGALQLKRMGSVSALEVCPLHVDAEFADAKLRTEYLREHRIEPEVER